MERLLKFVAGIVVFSCSVVGAQGGEAMFEDKVIVPLPADHTHRGMTGSILPNKDGSLLLVYSAVEDYWLRKAPQGGVAGRKSTDGGKTWGEPFVFWPRVGLSETTHPSLKRLKDGALIFAYDVQNVTTDDPNAGGDQHAYVRLSSDEGKTWTDQFCAAFTPGICHQMPDKVVQLSTGRIIMPVESSWPVEGRYYVSFCYYSDNGGYGWWPSKNVVDLGSTTEEPSVAECPDGRLIMMCRNWMGYMARSYSEDRGVSWSKPELVKQLPASAAGFHLVAVPGSGHLLLIWCHNTFSPAHAAGKDQTKVTVAQLKDYPRGSVRAPLTSAISTDGGKSWEHFRDITHDPEGVYGDYGYPGITFLDEGKLVLVNYHAIDGLHLLRAGIDWFYGK